MPPKAKIYEAFSAVADGRVVLGEAEATVKSSNGERTYKVRWSPDFSEFSSNDSASVWQGYTGYPIIAVLIELGILRSASETTRLLKGINWNELNKQFKRDYDAAVDHALQSLSANDRVRVLAQAEAIYEELVALKISKLTKRALS